MKHCLPLIIFLLAALTVQAQNATKAELSVYPNPTADYISVNDANDEVSYVVILNLVGKKVKEFDFIKGESLFIADLPKSMYLVQLQNRKRTVLKTQKVDKR